MDLRDAHRDAIASALAYFINGSSPTPVRQRGQNELRSAADFACVDHFLCLHRVDYFISHLIIPNLGRRHLAMVEARHHHFLWNAGGAVIPELVKVFTSTDRGHVKEVVTSAEEGGASPRHLVRLRRWNFSAYYIGAGDGVC